MQQSTLNTGVASEVLMDGADQKSYPPPRSAVIVEPELADALIAVSTLSTAGFHVTVAEGFVEARALLTSYRPALLIAGMQLCDYNGLHLVLHGKSVRPDMAPVITTRRPDHALEAEATRMGATVVPMPTTEAELLAAVIRTIVRTPGDATAITAPFERRTHERRSTLNTGDVSGSRINIAHINRARTNTARTNRAQTNSAGVLVEKRVGERRRGLERLLGSAATL